MSGMGEKIKDRSVIHTSGGDRVFEIDEEGHCFVDGERWTVESYKEELRRVRQEQNNEGLFSHLEKTWLPRLLHHGASWDEFVERPDVDDGKDDRRRYRIYTNDHFYAITAVVKAGGGTYLGCVASARKPRAGEEHTRGNDLPDGEFNYDTWLRIVHAIVGYELVPLKRSNPGVEDEEKEDSAKDAS